MKKISLILLGLFLVAGVHAQSLGDYKVVDKGRAHKRMKKKAKRVFISEFQVNYQLGLALVDEKKGGRQFGGGVKGDTKASLVVGLKGIEAAALQELTDKLYNEYVADLEAQGFEIVTPEEVFEHPAIMKKRDKRWEIKTYEEGPMQGDYFGSVVTKPHGFKTVAPLYKVNPANPASNIKGMYIAQTEMKLEQTADFILNKVTVVVQAFENSQGAASKIISKMSKTATVKAETNFRVSGEWSNNAYNIYSIFSVNDIPINGVIEKQKFNVQTAPDRDSWGTNMGAFTVFKADNREYSNFKTVTCDANAYIKGAEMGAKAFLDGTLQKMLEVIN